MWVEPQLSLMFRPLGCADRTTTSAPSSRNTLGATLYVAPWAQSMTTFRPAKLVPVGTLLLQNSI
ncbi:hypothetical protein D3C72_2436070 [compost metagenome]